MINIRVRLVRDFNVLVVGADAVDGGCARQRIVETGRRVGRRIGKELGDGNLLFLSGGNIDAEALGVGGAGRAGHVQLNWEVVSRIGRIAGVLENGGRRGTAGNA